MNRLMIMLLLLLMITGLIAGVQEFTVPPDTAGSGAQQQIRQTAQVKTFEKRALCQQIMEVRSLISGKVSDVLVEKGERVRTGQLLLHLDSASVEQGIKETENSLKNWKEVLSRREHWKVRSQRAEQQARSKVEEYQKQLQALESELSRREVHALLPGRLIDIVPGGTEVSEETVVARIGDDSVLKIDLSPEDIQPTGSDALKGGEHISLKFREIDLVCSGEIRRKADGVTILIPNEKYLISPGMTASFQVEIQPLVKSLHLTEKEEQISKSKKDPKKRKIEWEISSGLAYSDPGDYHYRALGIDALIDQIAGNYGIDYTVSGNFIKNILTVPFQGLINFSLSGKWYLKAGLEFGYGRYSPSKTYVLDWTTLDETVRYDLSMKLTYWMPFVGVETRFGVFGIYANFGFNILSFSHQKDYESSTGSFWFRQNDSISADGSGFGMLLGGKYIFNIGKKMDLLIKLELCYLKIENLKGKRDTTQSSSTGEMFSESVSGSIYSFEINPYDLGWFNYWELYETLPSGADFRNVGNMLLNLSSIRLMMGIVF